MNQTKYIHVGQLDKKLFYKLGIKLITEDVFFTYERLNHVETKRVQLYKEIKEILPNAIYNPDYIYKDWNNRKETLILVKSLDEKHKLNIVIKLAIINDKKHIKNSIITIIKIGNKTFNKILKNKEANLLFKN